MLLRYCCRIRPGPGLSAGLVVLDGLDLATNLLRGEAIEPALSDNHEDGKQCCQSQHGRFELPEAVFLHHSRATAGGQKVKEHYCEKASHFPVWRRYFHGWDVSSMKSNKPGSKKSKWSLTSCTRLGWIWCSWLVPRIPSVCKPTTTSETTHICLKRRTRLWTKGAVRWIYRGRGLFHRSACCIDSRPERTSSLRPVSLFIV